MIKAIIFDLWNTLASKPSVSSLIKKRFNINVEDFTKKYEEAIQLKQWSSMEELARSLLKTFDILFSEENISFITQAFRNAINDAAPKKGAKELLEKLKNNYTLALLSNTSNFEIIKEEWDMQEVFDVIKYSWENCKLKPEKESFDSICGSLNTSPEDCVFIDDCKENVDAAISNGLKGIQFNNLEQLINDLNKLNVKI